MSGPQTISQNIWIKRLAYLTCFSTLFLIFVGGLVKSTESGLAVPDWPLSYGMLFPPMVGGVFYEHGHRMVAAGVGFLTLCLAFMIQFNETRQWVKTLGWVALGVVIAQGVLGGITVLFYLPTAISSAHAILAQTFFIITVVLAYSQSEERRAREDQGQESGSKKFISFILFFIFLVYLQLFAGALMRHTQAGLAIPDFPTMGGQWIPQFNEAMLLWINDWRFENNLEAVTMQQVLTHFSHRLGAFVLTIAIIILNVLGLKEDSRLIKQGVFLINICFVLQVVLGMFTVLTAKEPIITSIHVAVGGATLGVSALLFLRSAPLSLNDLRITLSNK